MEAEPELANEFFVEWCRLNGYKPATSPIDKMIDEATGVWKDRIAEFADDVDDLIFQRLEQPNPIESSKPVLVGWNILPPPAELEEE